jgi:hypothetical protein
MGFSKDLMDSFGGITWELYNEITIEVHGSAQGIAARFNQTVYSMTNILGHWMIFSSHWLRMGLNGRFHRW